MWNVKAGGIVLGEVDHLNMCAGGAVVLGAQSRTGYALCMNEFPTLEHASLHILKFLTDIMIYLQAN